LSEKLNSPGKLAKNGDPVAPTVRETGTVMALVALNRITSPLYVPTASVGDAFTETVNVRGVVQQKPLGVTESQFPPVALNAVAVKANGAPRLVAVIVCGNGLAPPNGFVKPSPLI
jgi:hypothetical protein